MLPREHGAYAEAGFPLAAAMAVTGVTVSGTLIAAVVVAAFLAHEPVSVLLGTRGARARHADRRTAVRWLSAAATTALVAGAAAWFLTPSGLRWSLLVPLLPALVFAICTTFGHEKTIPGQVAGATAFAGAAVPITLVGGGSLTAALAIAIPFAALFTTGALAVRLIVVGSRGGGNLPAVRRIQRVLLALAVAIAIAVLWSVNRAGIPALAAAAVIPGLSVSVLLALHPPPAKRLRSVGWTLVVASIATFALTVAGARG